MHTRFIIIVYILFWNKYGTIIKED